MDLLLSMFKNLIFKYLLHLLEMVLFLFQLTLVIFSQLLYSFVQGFVCLFMLFLFFG